MDAKYREKYEWITERYAELTETISQAEVISEPARYQAALKERSQLEEQVRAYQNYLQHEQHLLQARQMLEDPDLADMAQAEVRELEHTLALEEDELRMLLLPRDPDEDRAVILEIRGGAGGEEA